MRQVRILALDLDDTLLRSDLSISYRTRNAIKRTEKAGVTIVLASGRIPSAMDHSSRLLGLHKRPGYLISNNGALIQESHTGNVVHEAFLASHLARAICDLADAEGFAMQIYEDDVMYVSMETEYSRTDQRLTGIRQVVVENFRAMVKEGCYKLIIPGEPAVLAHVESLIKTFIGENITLFTGRPYLLEIMSRDTDKGTALTKVAEILNVSADEVMAIGNSSNDEAMIKWAGIGVAMANADEQTKKIANLVTDDTNDDDGVAELIEKFFFDGGGSNA